MDNDIITFSDIYRGGYIIFPNILISTQDFAYNILQDDTKTLRYSGLVFDDIANGAGVGCSLFTQYCSHKCRGCQNPCTWSREGGEVFTQEIFDSIMDYFEKRPEADHLTLSGGDPLDNLELSNYVAAEFKRRYPNKKLWIWTGYLLEDLVKDKKYWAILELCDVLVDGPFILEQRDITLKWRGSSNQRVINMPETIKQNKIILESC